jgi:hypothetical protein
MTSRKQDEGPKKHMQQEADLGQKEAAVEKEKETELHRMGKPNPNDARGNKKEPQSR